MIRLNRRAIFLCALGLVASALVAFVVVQQVQLRRLVDRVATLERGAAYPRYPEVPPACKRIPCDVSMIALLSNPGRFDGLMISTRGLYSSGFERSALYPPMQGGGVVEGSDGIWVEGSPRGIERNQNVFVRVYGRFKLGRGGHLGQYIGVLERPYFTSVMDVEGKDIPGAEGDVNDPNAISYSLTEEEEQEWYAERRRH